MRVLNQPKGYRVIASLLNAATEEPTPTTRAEWLAQRRTGIGGSDAGAICGVDQWKSSLEVWYSKVEPLDDDDPGEKARWGNLLEPVVAEEWAHREGVAIISPDVLFRSVAAPFAIANVDRLVVDADGTPIAIYEGKTTDARNGEQWDVEPPERVQAQVHHYLTVTGLPRAHVACLIGGNNLRAHVIEANPLWSEHLLEIEAAFWDLVEKRTPPAPDGSDSAHETLAAMFHSSEPESVIDLPNDVLEVVERLRANKAAVKQLEREVQADQDAVCAALGRAEVGFVAGQKVASWKPVSTRRLDTKALTAAHPDLVEEFMAESSYRRFMLAKASR